MADDGQQYTIQFKKPEKIGAFALIAAGIATIGYTLYLTLPTLIELAQETIYFAAELIVAVVLLLVFANRSTWTTINYAIANQLRKIRKAIVHEDPIGILTTVITRFTARQVEINDALVQSGAAIKRHATQIKAAQKKADDEKALAEQAQRDGLPQVQIAQHYTAAERWIGIVETMKPDAAAYLEMQTALEQAMDLCQAKINDFTSRKEARAMQLDMAQNKKAVVSRFKKFFGNNQDLEMQDMANEDIERETSEAEAEVDQLMRVVNPMLKDADLKKKAEASQAMARFGQFATKALPEGGTVEGVVITDKEAVKR